MHEQVLDHADWEFGLLGLRVHGGTVWIWHGRWIDVAREMGEPLARTTTFTVAGIVIMAASCVASLALVANARRSARWSRRSALVALAVAIAAVFVFLATTPELEDPSNSRYLPSWSLIAFSAGAAAAILTLHLTSARSNAAARS